MGKGTEKLTANSMKTVPDVIRPSLTILFIGFNPSLLSAEKGHHFAGPSNRFWGLLYDSGLTSRKFRSEEDQELLDLNYGITNIVARPTKTAAEITRAEYDEGRDELRKKLTYYKPKIACYVGMGVYRQFTRISQVACGIQPASAVSGIIDFVVSSSSGLNRIPLKQQRLWFCELKLLAEKMLFEAKN
jgi:TDG/mug DNA glycosylase family protein